MANDAQSGGGYTRCTPSGAALTLFGPGNTLDAFTAPYEATTRSPRTPSGSRRTACPHTEQLFGSKGLLGSLQVVRAPRGRGAPQGESVARLMAVQPPGN